VPTLQAYSSFILHILPNTTYRCLLVYHIFFYIKLSSKFTFSFRASSIKVKNMADEISSMSLDLLHLCSHVSIIIIIFRHTYLVFFLAVANIIYHFAYR
ncbi:hypothetical protein L9F63_012411, partial [Diploptera punctata]